MPGTEDRRQDLRREEDRVFEFRLDKLEQRQDGFETTLLGLGSATGHLALLDSRVDENRRRVTLVEQAVSRIEVGQTDIRVALEGVRVRVAMAAGVGSLIGAGVVAFLVKLAGG